MCQGAPADSQILAIRPYAILWPQRVRGVSEQEVVARLSRLLQSQWVQRLLHRGVAAGCRSSFTPGKEPDWRADRSDTGSIRARAGREGRVASKATEQRMRPEPPGITRYVGWRAGLLTLMGHYYLPETLTALGA